jgi:hypothetical protein
MAGTPAAAAGPLSAADIDAFNHDGFVLLRGFFSPEDVATARAGLDVLTDQRRDAVSSWFACLKHAAIERVAPPSLGLLQCMHGQMRERDRGGQATVRTRNSCSRLRATVLE